MIRLNRPIHHLLPTKGLQIQIRSLPQSFTKHMTTSTSTKASPTTKTSQSPSPQPKNPRSISKPQSSLPASYYRGGTSRALIFNRAHLPSDPKEWNQIFRGCIGSPDGYGRQLDGLGGGISSLSKVLVIGKVGRGSGGNGNGNGNGNGGRNISSKGSGNGEGSEKAGEGSVGGNVVGNRKVEEEVDVDYTFAAIGIRDGDVDFSANCGNMSSAVGPFAVDEGLVDVSDLVLPPSIVGENGNRNGNGGESEGDDGKERLVKVRIRNTNTGKIISSTFPVVGFGTEKVEAATEGDFEIDGVEGKAARVELEFEKPGGSKTGKLFPTGNVVDILDGIPATCIDCGNPCVFIPTTSISLPSSTILPPEITTHPTLLGQLEHIRRLAAVSMNLCKTPETAPVSIPKIAMISKPESHFLFAGDGGEGRWMGKKDIDVVVRAISVGQPHRAVPITVAMAVAAAAEVEGSVVQGCLGEGYWRRREEMGGSGGSVSGGKGVEKENKEIMIGHPTGKILVGTRWDGERRVEGVSVFRTARRIMRGEVYWRQE